MLWRPRATAQGHLSYSTHGKYRDREHLSALGRGGGCVEGFESAPGLSRELSSLLMSKTAPSALVDLNDVHLAVNPTPHHQVFVTPEPAFGDIDAGECAANDSPGEHIPVPCHIEVILRAIFAATALSSAPHKSHRITNLKVHPILW